MIVATSIGCWRQSWCCWYLAVAGGAIGLGADTAAAQPQIGENSCQGVDACTGLTAHVGDNSCNGFEACFNSSGKIGDGSCNGDRGLRIQQR